VVYLLGVSEIGLNHRELALEDFEHAVSLDPRHQRALLALGELQLTLGDARGAVTSLEKAFQLNGGDWRTHFLLASAYSKAGHLPEAESHAQRAITLAREKGADSYLLLGEIQQAEGKITEARQTWQRLIANFPGDSAAEKAQKEIAPLLAGRDRVAPGVELVALPVHALPSLELAPPSEQPWAPPDIDSLEYPLAKNTPCQTEEVLAGAERRLRSELQNFEKFTATEHIEHQEIDRYGRPGETRSRDFSYIVFVFPYKADSFYLDEERTPVAKDDSFPSPLATSGLNNLGVAVLQPFQRENLVYRCEGLSNVRGRAAWQRHFEEKKAADTSIREWRRNGQLYSVPVKGRLWVSSGSFDLLRIETDLREPLPALGLTRDHLAVDYGPVKFRSTDTSLWLPWSAEMFMELRGHRYHHRHSLSDYLLFEVETDHKIGKPKEPAAPQPSPRPQMSEPSSQ